MKALAAIAIGCFSLGVGVGWAISKCDDVDTIVPILPRKRRR